MPTDLTSRLAWHEAERLADEIARQLQHRTPEELARRLQRHWRYWQFKLAAGMVHSVVAVAFRMLRRDFDDCPDVRCEDGWHLDKDQACQHCIMVAEFASRRTSTPRASSEGASRAGQPVGSPLGVRTESAALNGPATATAAVPLQRPSPLPPQRVAQHAARARAMLAAALRAGASDDRLQHGPPTTSAAHA